MDLEKKPERKKFKSLIVWNLLLKRTDENHALNITEIQDMLADYAFRHLIHDADFHLLLAPTLEQTEGLLIAFQGFGA